MLKVCLLSIALSVVSITATAHNAFREDCIRALAGDREDDLPSRPNHRQRQMVTAYELMKLKPRSNENVINFASDLPELSRQNLHRLLSQIVKVSRSKMSDEDALKVEDWAANLSVVGLTRLIEPFSGPIRPRADFYSALVGESKTLGLELAGTENPAQITSLRSHVKIDQFRAPDAFIRQYGIVLPHFTEPYSLYEFFAKWDPDHEEELIRINRYNLPSSALDKTKFREFLTAAMAEQVFPLHSLYHRMAPLRENLYKFVLTVNDAEVFFRHVVEAYITICIESESATMEEFEKQWNKKGGPGYIFDEALEAAGWVEGAAVRVPINLPLYTIVRAAEVRGPLRLPRALDSRRLDHDSKP